MLSTVIFLVHSVLLLAYTVFVCGKKEKATPSQASGVSVSTIPIVRNPIRKSFSHLNFIIDVVALILGISGGWMYLKPRISYQIFYNNTILFNHFRVPPALRYLLQWSPIFHNQLDFCLGF